MLQSSRASWVVFLVVFLMGLSGSFFAGDAFANLGFDLSAPRSPHRVSLTGASVPSSQSSGSTGGYGERSLALSGSFSLYRDFEMEGMKPVFTGFSIQPLYNRRNVSELGSVNRSVRLDTVGASFSLFHLAANGEAYIASVGMSVSGETGKPDARYWNPTIFGVATHHFTPATSLLYGVAFTTNFGVFIPLPALGLHSKLSEDWTFVTVLPVLTRISYRATPDLSLAAFMRGVGYRTQIANEGRFPGKQNEIDLKARAFELGGGMNYEISKVIAFDADAGFLVARRLKFSDDSGDLLEQNLKSASFTMSAGVTLRLGESGMASRPMDRPQGSAPSETRQ